eukprot:1428976-Pyramimonas_sp.AAC.1
MAVTIACTIRQYHCLGPLRCAHSLWGRGRREGEDRLGQAATHWKVPGGGVEGHPGSAARRNVWLVR